ncbi:MAG: rod shape-determining protein MreC [Candidatus Omnitrophota bacterium]
MPRFYNREKKWIFTAILIAGMVILSFLPPVRSAIKNVAVTIATSPVRCWTNAGRYFRKKLELIQENDSLRKEAADLSLKIEQFKELRKENARLRDLLDFKKRSEFETVAAGIIARDPNTWVGSFIIDKGRQDGLEKDSAVCSAQGLLGKIAELSEKTSSVILVSHPTFRSGGKIKNTYINGIIVGLGKGRARMLYLPIDADIRRNSIVMTSDYSRIFPKGIIVGRIIDVGKSKTGLYKYADIKPSADPLAQEEILCVK